MGFLTPLEELALRSCGSREENAAVCRLRLTLGCTAPATSKTARLLNLSLGGCFFATSKPSRKGEFLQISFYTSGMVLRGKGVVRHVLPKSGMGIEFSDVSPEFRAALSFLISPKQ